MENANGKLAALQNSSDYSDRVKGRIIAEVMGGRLTVAIQLMKTEKVNTEDVRKWITENGFTGDFKGNGKILNELTMEYRKGGPDSAWLGREVYAAHRFGLGQ